MRLGLIALVLAVACGRIGFEPVSHSMLQGLQCGGSGSPYEEGKTYAAGDGCNTCTCTTGVFECTTLSCRDACATCGDGASSDGAAVDDPCAPSGGCTTGPVCGAAGQCCNTGEQCVGGVCMCGMGPACTGLDFCTPLIANMPGNTCGTLCCHDLTCPN